MAAPHRHSGACGCAEEAKQADAVSSSLYPAIDRDGIWCLNAADSDGGLRCVKPWDERNNDRRLLSDPDDGEMLLHIPFTASVHIRSLACMAWGDWRPSRLRLFVNRPDLDLASVGDAGAPAQDIELAEDTEGYIDYPLKAAKFQNVSSLSVHVPGSIGGEGAQSGIQFVHLKGVSTNHRREVVNVVYESRANPADHNKTKDESAPSQAAQ